MQKADNELNLEFRIRLQEEFARRLRVNERYSIRSFASHLKVDSSTLSKILAGKRYLSESKINEFCLRLGMATPGNKAAVETGYETLQIDTFSVISDWYHFAILDLTLLKSFRNDVKWIARKLAISELQVVGALDRLKRLGLLIETKGKLRKGQSFYTNYEEGVTSAALKEYQRQVLKKALHAIDNCPQDAKDITSMTIAVNSKKLKKAKEKIKNFRRELCAFLEEGEGDAVYHLALQLYPVTSLEN